MIYSTTAPYPLQVQNPMIVLRSLLFVPGNNPRMLEKALGQVPDAIVPDLEDSVPCNKKISARDTVSAFLPRLIETGIPIIPRVNSINSGLVEKDLAELIIPGIFGITIGKINSAKEMYELSEAIDKIEIDKGIDRGVIRLIPWIETAKSILHAYEISSSSHRVIAVAFGAEDFANDMAIERTEDGNEIAYARAAVCTAAKAAGVTPLDTPYVSFRNEIGLRKENEVSKQFGFVGRFAIHPLQIKVINESFSPSSKAVDNARRIVEAFELAERQGTGAISIDGNMIDTPIVKRAQGVLDLVERIKQG